MAEENGQINGNGRDAMIADAGRIQSASAPYEICVKGQLNSQWSDWLGGLEIKLLENGEMVLSGLIADQAALMGILKKLSRLNLALLSLNPIDKNGKE